MNFLARFIAEARNKLVGLAKTFFSDKANIALVLILIIAAVLRFYKLGTYGLWLDEIFSVLRAEQGLGYLFSKPLDFNLTYVLIFLELFFGKSEFIIRFYSAFFGVLGVLALYLSCRKLWGKKLALLSSFLLSFNYFHIYYSQDARYYAVVFFFSVLSLYFLFSWLEERNFKYAVFLAVISFLGTRTHPTFLLLIASELLFLLSGFFYWIIRERSFLAGIRKFGIDPTKLFKNFKKAHLVSKLLLVGLTPLVIFFLYYTFPISSIIARFKFHWFPTDRKYLPVFFEPSFKFYTQLFENFSGMEWALGRWILMGLFTVGWFSNFFKERKYLGFFGPLLFAAPFFLIWLLNMHEAFVYRYIMFMLPLWIVFIAQGVLVGSRGLISVPKRLFPPFKDSGYAVSVVALSISVLYVFHPTIPKLVEHYNGMHGRFAWREMAQCLKECYESDDIIYANTADAVQSIPYYLYKLEGKSTLENPVVASSALYLREPVEEFKLGRYRIITTRERLKDVLEDFDGTFWYAWHNTDIPEVGNERFILKREYLFTVQGRLREYVPINATGGSKTMKEFSL